MFFDLLYICVCNTYFLCQIGEGGHHTRAVKSYMTPSRVYYYNYRYLLTTISCNRSFYFHLVVFVYYVYFKGSITNFLAVNQNLILPPTTMLLVLTDKLHTLASEYDNKTLHIDFAIPNVLYIKISLIIQQIHLLN